MRSFSGDRRIAIKAGTSILTNRQGRFSKAQLENLGEQILRLFRLHKETVLISSGAIGLGMDVCGFVKRPEEMCVLQACAAIGQGKLMHAYEQFFSKHGLHTAQILLTRDGLEQRDRFLKARQTFEELIRLKTLPIVNENDTVATEEIRFGDNDVLSVQVAHLIESDLLIMLSDVDGFYLKDGSRVREVTSEEEMDRELVKHLENTKTAKTVGGMKAKLAAARVAMRLGIPMLIVNGHDPEILEKVLKGEDVGTLFHPGKKARSARKKWIAFSAARHGSLIVDDGAYKALQDESKSLLASGIIKIKGDFKAKDVVELETLEGKVFGRGIVRYAQSEVVKIAGKKSGDIKSLLGERFQGEVIHRNDLVIWG